MKRIALLLSLLASCSEPRIMTPATHVYTIPSSVQTTTTQYDCQPNYNDPIDPDDYRLECPRQIPSIPVLDGGA